MASKPPTKRVEFAVPDKPRSGMKNATKSMTKRFLSQGTEKLLGRQVSPSTARPEAETLLWSLAPCCSQAVASRLRQEKISTAADLANLDKEDLKELGLSMVERGRVLSWSRSFAARKRHSCRDAWMDDESDGTSIDNEEDSDGQSVVMPLPNDSYGCYCELEPEQEHKAKLRLEELEADADFWDSLTHAWTATAPLAVSCQQVLDSTATMPMDVRENLLERLFDLSPDRVSEVYGSMRAHAAAEGGEQIIREEALAHGLHLYGLPEPDTAALRDLLEAVMAAPAQGLQQDEFEAILSRIVLAQLLTCLQGDRLSPPSLFVTDYSARGTKTTPMALPELREFFFGHRPTVLVEGELPPVRWVHLKGVNLPLLLSLGVKYSLHPLAVEDTIQQRQTKLDSYGHHLFGTIERISLRGLQKDSEPVRVQSHHVAFFCAGAPALDTVVTVSQEDSSFEQEWPGGPSESPLTSLTSQGTLDAAKPQLCLEKVRRRLEQPLSRLRERRANFLIHAVLDVCADELCEVVAAYGKRLRVVQKQLLKLGTSHLAGNYLEEVATVRRQLTLVNRRAKSLQRIVRRILDDRDFSIGMTSYLQDVVDHLDEVLEDSGRLFEKCGGLQQSHEQLVDREQERLRQRLAEQQRRQELRRSEQADRLNNILFVLTLVTTVFAPVQLLAGVYGMNFVDKDGHPTIPELLWKDGYAYFWVLVWGYLAVASALAVCLYRRLQPRIDGGSALVEEDEEQPAAAVRSSRRRLTTQSTREPLLLGSDAAELPTGASAASLL